VKCSKHDNPSFENGAAGCRFVDYVMHVDKQSYRFIKKMNCYISRRNIGKRALTNQRDTLVMSDLTGLDGAILTSAEHCVIVDEPAAVNASTVSIFNCNTLRRVLDAPHKQVRVK